MAHLTGKVAVITGAANGIGLAAARLFAPEGAKLVLVDFDETALTSAAAAIGPAASCVAADVSEASAAARYSEAALRLHGRIDVAVLNAGIEGQVAPIAELPLAVFDRVIAVNLRGVWLGLAALMPVLRRGGGGSIVITSSIAGLKGTPGLAAYGASKHAVAGLMKSAALEGAPHGIRVNAVHPGPIETRMMAAIDRGRNPADAAAAHAATAARIPLRRYARDAEIAALMLFLASEQSSYCTGATYTADGGVTAG